MSRKALLAALALALCAFAFLGGGGASAEQAAIIPKSFDGKVKAYYSSPMSVAHAEVGGAQMVIVGEAGKLVVYVDDGQSQSVYEKAIFVENPFKMEVFQNYLFVYDYLYNTSLAVYDLGGIYDIEYWGAFSQEGRPIGDFSIEGEELLILSANTVYRHELRLEADAGLATSPSGSLAIVAGLPTYIVALGEGRLAYLNNAGDLMETDMDGSYQKAVGEKSSRHYIKHFGGSLYYLHNFSELVRYDLETGERDTLPLSDNGGRPLSRHIASVQNLFADEEGVFVLDERQKKVVKLGHDLGFSGFCLDSFSFEEGRFNAPKSVSCGLSKLIVADSGRVQIFGEGAPRSLILGFTPDFALAVPSDTLYLIGGGKVYLYREGEAAEIAQLDDIRDAKVYSEKLYLLTGSALYALEESGALSQLLGSLPLGEPKKLAVNEKTGNIYILAGDRITVYGVGLNAERAIDVSGPAFAAMETDFMGNVFLLSQSGIVRVDQEGGRQAYSFSGARLGGLAGLAIDPINGRVYFASSSSHEVYYCEKQELGVKVAGDIPEIALPSNPLGGGEDYEAEVVEVLGYPSTLFYPFSESAKGQPFYPEGLAHEGGLKYIPQGAKLLSILSVGDYRLAFFEGRLGFVLSDKLKKVDAEQPTFEDGFMLTACGVYSYPYAGEALVKGSLKKLDEVKLLGFVPSFDEAEFPFALIEYGEGERGYVCSSFIAQRLQGLERPYVEARVYSGSGEVPVYGEDGKTVLFTLDDDAAVRIYYYKGGYAFVWCEKGMGYVMEEHIGEDRTFERQRTGFLMLIGTVAVGALFWVIKKRHLTV